MSLKKGLVTKMYKNVPFFTLAALFVLLFAFFFFFNDVKTSYGSAYTVIEIRKNQATIKPSHY